jgi:uncharacterized membrane protein (UPF0127 family)
VDRQKVVLVKGSRLPTAELANPPSVICHEVRIADSFAARLIGLLGKRRLEPGAGLIIEPCSSIHTFGMAFPIDVITLDRDDRVLGTWSHVRPWRMKVFGRGTRRVLELASGSIQRTDIAVGDLLRIV